jgi:hypothetical protein
MYPLDHQEIVRARHSDRIREATNERLAAQLREGEPSPVQTSKLGERALRWVTSVMRRPSVHPA